MDELKQIKSLLISGEAYMETLADSIQISDTAELLKDISVFIEAEELDRAMFHNRDVVQVVEYIGKHGYPRSEPDRLKLSDDIEEIRHE